MNAAQGTVGSDPVILATAGYDHTVRFWQAHSGICTRTVQHQDSVSCHGAGARGGTYLGRGESGVTRGYGVTGEGPGLREGPGLGGRGAAVRSLYDGRGSVCVTRDSCCGVPLLPLAPPAAGERPGDHARPQHDCGCR